MKRFKNYTKICSLCGKEFTAYNKNRIYCCDSCKQQAYILRNEKFDAFCQEQYFKYSQDFDRYNKTPGQKLSNNTGNSMLGMVAGVALDTYLNSRQQKKLSYLDFKSILKKKHK